MSDDLYMWFYTGPGGMRYNQTRYVYMIGSVSIRETIKQILLLFNYDMITAYHKSFCVVSELNTFDQSVESVKYSWLNVNYRMLKRQINDLQTHNVYVCWQFMSPNSEMFNIDGNIVHYGCIQQPIEDPFATD